MAVHLLLKSQQLQLAPQVPIVKHPKHQHPKHQHLTHPHSLPKSHSPAVATTWVHFLCTHGLMAKVHRTIVNMHPDVTVDISYDVKGKTIVKPGVPRSALVSVKP